ncbi:hypothetical protein H4R19_001712 [Coemansia spiralis]|nr:hypothetical protein H4R19_001712 [Coemansia spiralis]
MEDSLDTYISQSLIDRAGDGTPASAAVGSELLMQMLLSTMGAGSADDLPPAPETVDPSTLNAMDVDDYTVAVADSDTADTNSLLAAALLSALGPLPDIAAPIDVPVAASATTGAAATMPRSPTAAAQKAEVTRSSAVGPARQAARQPAPAARGPPQASARRPAPRMAGAPVVAPERTAAVTLPSRLSPDTAANHDDEDDDEGMEGIDLTNLTSKERRQLRNKISARNFRVRRKEYISNLEGEVRVHKEEADSLRRDLLASRKDNALLREEIRKLRMRLVPQRPAPAKAAPAALQAAPMVRFNPHKDIPQGTAKAPATTGPSATAGAWATKDSRTPFVAVNTAVLPSAHCAVADELVAEMRRKQAVDALLDMGKPTVPHSAPLDESDAFTALLCAASQTAELLLLQYALESSFASPLAPATAPAELPAVAAC